MAKNDFHVLAFRILCYLYGCMKAGEQPDQDKISHEILEVNKTYWIEVFQILLDEKFVSGISIVSTLGKQDSIKFINPKITLKGIEFLQENSIMQKAKTFLKEIKEIVPGM